MTMPLPPVAPVYYWSRSQSSSKTLAILFPLLPRILRFQNNGDQASHFKMVIALDSMTKIMALAIKLKLELLAFLH